MGGASYWQVAFLQEITRLTCIMSKHFCVSLASIRKKAGGIATATASDVLNEFEAVIIDTAKIKLFLAENEASSKTSVSLVTPLININVDFGQ